MRIIRQRAAPAVQIVVHQIVVGLQLLPTLLPQVQLLPVVEVAAHREDLVLELDRLVSEVAPLRHLLEVDQLVGVDVELEYLLVEALRPPAAQDVDRFPLGYGCCVGEGEEEFGREDCPFVGLGVVDFDGREALLSVVAAEDVDAALADDGREGAARGIESAYGPPLLREDIVGLAARHALILPVVPADHVDLAVEIHAGVLLPRKIHRLLLLQPVLVARGVEVAVAGGAAPRDEDLPGGEGAG